MKMKRIWAIPSKHTFTIKPIHELVERYRLEYGGIWIDPFAGFNSPAEIQNDLNPESPAEYNMKAQDFAQLDLKFDHVLFDPPYSPRQISECYKNIGLVPGMKDTQNGALYNNVKSALIPKVKPESICISFGWNSAGFGKTNGFDIIEILLVSHGGGHNDTIIVVDKKRDLEIDIFS